MLLPLRLVDHLLVIAGRGPRRRILPPVRRHPRAAGRSTGLGPRLGTIYYWPSLSPTFRPEVATNSAALILGEPCG